MYCQFCGLDLKEIKYEREDDKAVEKFLLLTTIEIVSLQKSISPSKSVCSECKQNVNRFNKFISKVMAFQKTQKTKPDEILKNVPKGITIKKVHSNGNSYDPLQVETLFVKSEPVETCVVKCEPLSEELENFPFSEDEADFFSFSNTSSSVKNVADLNFTCAQCKMSFEDFDTLTSHITSRVCSKASKCKFCPKQFDNRRNLHSHQKTHKVRKKQVSKVKCSVCQKAFNGSIELKLHMETHVKVVKQGFTFRCIKCRAAYNSHLDLINHTTQEHAKKKK